MAFRKKYQKVMDLKPDLLVLQECENDGKLKEHLASTNYNQLIWYGKNPHKGVAIISFNEVEIELNAKHNTEFEYIIPLRLRANERLVDLYAIWAMPHESGIARSYVGQIWSAINFYSDDLNRESILIGDFNSNAIWDRKRRVGDHSDVINFLNDRDIYSIYHQKTKSNHGAEKHPTLYLTKKETKPYHIDYCCASRSLYDENTTIEIGAYTDWIKLSDHMPIIIDGIL